MQFTDRYALKYGLLIIAILGHSLGVFAQPENKVPATEKALQQLLKWNIVGPFQDTLKNTSVSEHLMLARKKTTHTLKDTIYEQRNDIIDLAAIFKTNEKFVAYASCKVFSETDQEMVLFINADDRLRLWINDSLVCTVPFYTGKEAIVSTVLFKKGYNILTAEINNAGAGDWGFDMDIISGENAQKVSSAFLTHIPKNNITKDHPKTQLKNWKITGPFNQTLGNINEYQIGYLQHIPQNSTQTIIDTSYKQGKEGTYLDELLNTDMNGIAYAICDVIAEEDQDLALLVNADDEMRIWMNNSPLLTISGYTAWGAVIKKISIKKGVNRLMVEVRNGGGGTWWFDINTCSYEYIRNNMLLPEIYQSTVNFIVPKGDKLQFAITDTDFIPVNETSTVKIYDALNKNCQTSYIDLKKENSLPLQNLNAGAYRYELHTDYDTLTGYFCYGTIDEIYNRKTLIQKYEGKKTISNLLTPYIKRLDRLLGDYSKSPNGTLERKIVYCIYKLKEIDNAYQYRKSEDLNSKGLSIRMFASKIDRGDEHYLLYIPEKINKEKQQLPLVVIIPYITNNHPFYTGGIIANTERINYISKLAEKYGMAVIWPSSRIFKWYNQTPIITQAIIESIEDVCRHYNIDQKHIFLYGECSGGLFALQSATRRPDLFAAVAIEGPELGSIENAERENSGMLSNNLFDLTENLYGKPILFLHSGNDQKAPIYHSLRLMDSIKKNGGQVEYDDLNNLFRGTASKLYSEPECMSKTFAFFDIHKNSVPPAEKKIATYGFYNDTLYGIWIKEKESPGKAIISYKTEFNRLVLHTSNVKKIFIDTKKMGVANPKKLNVDLNGNRMVKGLDYHLQGTVLELTNNRGANKNSTHFTKEVHGPVNKVFLNRFALVRPKQADEKINAAISFIDSLWLDEYRNHVQIIDERQVDSATRLGVNLIYFVAEMSQIPPPLLVNAAIEVKKDTLSYDGENFSLKGASFVFYFRYDNGTDNIYLGVNSQETPAEMLKSVFIKKGWYDFEFWRDKYPEIQYSYGSNASY